MKSAIVATLGLAAAVLIAAACLPVQQSDARKPLSIRWEKNFLTIHGERLPGDIVINYLEAYCRPGSTDRDWGQTVIGHKAELGSASDDGRTIDLRDRLNDG